MAAAYARFGLAEDGGAVVFAKSTWFWRLLLMRLWTAALDRTIHSRSLFSEGRWLDGSFLGALEIQTYKGHLGALEIQ